ncbi:MAG: hypothetical protein ACOVSI_00825 [Gemmatimonas sp.]
MFLRELTRDGFVAPASSTMCMAPACSSPPLDSPLLVFEALTTSTR